MLQLSKSEKIVLFSCLIGTFVTAPAAAESRWTRHAGWGPAEPVAALNTAFGEGCPIETPDGLSLMIASTRDGDGVLDIWASDRDAVDAPWNVPRRLEAPINSASPDFCPSPSGRWLFFVSAREHAEACGPNGANGDIYVSRQSPAGGWSEPVHLGCAADGGPNTPGPERSPSLVETDFGTYLFYSTNGGAGDNDIYMSRMRADGSFGPGRVVESLSSEFEDFMPNVRAREHGIYEVVFNSNRPRSKAANGDPAGDQDIYTAKAWFWIDYWTRPRNLGPNVNTKAGTSAPGNETRATLSSDGSRLTFGRDGDIFVSERTRRRQR